MRRLKQENGASAVEFAMIASLLLVVLFGTIQFGVVYNRLQGVQAAAREGARQGSLPGTPISEILTRVQNSVSIINGSTINTLCPANDPVLTLGAGCIRVTRRTATTSTVLTNMTDVPCSLTAGNNLRLFVEVYWRTRIDIPLWASPQLNLNSGAEFRCEIGS